MQADKGILVNPTADDDDDDNSGPQQAYTAMHYSLEQNGKNTQLYLRQ